MKRSPIDPPLSLVLLVGCVTFIPARAQTVAAHDLSAQVQQLNQEVAKAQAQIQESQRQLDAMRQQLAALQAQVAAAAPSAEQPTAPQQAELDALLEHQQVQQSEIATHEQSKVESASKFPVRVSGLVLFNAFGNTAAVDWAATPSLAEGGSGSTGLAIRQSILGLDAIGPHLWGAQSFADAHIDFDGQPQSNSSNYSGVFYLHNAILRLRTAHAGLRWTHSELWAGLDRPILSPDMPASLAATSTPPLAWSGNLWAWNPQVAAQHDVEFSNGRALRLQAALIDVQDGLLPPLATSQSTVRSLYTSFSEQSRSPGFEGRFALLGSLSAEHTSHVGAGAYVAPHLLPDGSRYNAWAVTLDAQMQLPGHFQLTGNAYRGAALSGLGAGAYKDFAYSLDRDHPGSYYYRPLDDVGGWAQLTQRPSSRLEFNTAFGIDNVFASELHQYPIPGTTAYQTLARNRTVTANIIASPSAYISLSFEYRHIMSSPIASPTLASDIFGLAAGYRF